ncbi:hypothetical protein F7725_024935 [Dissostichus mawsoni]|uniref:Polypeptide N-acetylgalactosaminyltransferase n=1 Tax=Dissostichus mawsoni TaxID=36200 RepID=A0A7J5X9X5_DISMA|nr:hypothetical protein F7725_024935 [Dissostichus mawsoni]
MPLAAAARFALVTLALSDFLNRDRVHSHQNPVPPRRPLQGIPNDLEVIVDSRDPALELGVDLAPLKSLQEDQLLFVPSMQGTKNLQQRKGTYKVLLPGANKDTRTPAPPTHGEMGKAVQLEEREVESSVVQKYGFNEVCCYLFPRRAWSTLLRTVHSVLDTAPKQYLQEVLLVDDMSQHGHLKSVLSEYVSHLDGVRLIRSTKRLGVGGCRTLGSARAAGEVLVFMDSHCECQKGWLEPLLERVAQDRTRVVSPIMDVIDWQTFHYNATQWPVRGVFDWRLDFYWESKPELQEKDPDSAVRPVQSPVLGGGVVAIDRHFFQSVGTYDPGMLLWGGNKLSCVVMRGLLGGGSLFPCGPPGPHHLPYSFPDDELIQRNKIRFTHSFTSLRTDLHCQESCTMSALAAVQTTLEGRGQRAGHEHSTHCELNSELEVRWGPMGALCLDAKDERALSGQLVHQQSQLCLEVLKEGGLPQSSPKEVKTGGLFLRPCTHQPRQQWHFEQLVAPRGA